MIELQVGVFMVILLACAGVTAFITVQVLYCTSEARYRYLTEKEKMKNELELEKLKLKKYALDKESETLNFDIGTTYYTKTIQK